jgi:uncharacterized protein (DUF362 family)
MFRKMNRRDFMKTGTAIGVGTALSQKIIPELILADEAIDIAVVKGSNYFENTIKAVKMLGGMGKFVPINSKVVLLPNPQSNNPGTYTKPEIVRAAIQMCKEAGASEIACLGWLSLRYRRNTGIKKVLDEEGAQLVIADAGNESLFKPVPVSKGVILREARIMRAFYNYDIFINMNITKEHSGNNFSGALKNLMGINSPASDRTFHKRIGIFKREDTAHLDQCIADLNTIIRPQLCIADSTEFVITNGPDGPGKLRKPQKVAASTDPVAIDAYCSTLFDYRPTDILAIKKAHEHGLGEMDLTKLKIKEVVV